MDFDAFSEGIEPGGLRNTRDIGILICYMLTNISRPFPQEDLIEIIQDNGIANYFETNSALSELIKCGNIKNNDDNPELIEITSNGILISQQLSSELSMSVRHKAVTATMKLSERRKIEKENPVSITKIKDGGYKVDLRITDGIRDLMEISLFVPDRSDANAVKRRFHSDPEKFYSVVLAASLGDYDIITQTLKELENEKKPK